MLGIALILIFILACAFMFGLTLLLFRDQLTSRASFEAEPVSPRNP
jgi:hypothetical protein